MSAPTHLHPAIIPYLSMSKAKRIERIQSSRWVGYPKAKEVLARMEDLMHRPRVSRMTGMALMARAFNGKSEILKHLEKMHPATNDPNTEALHMPVVLLECPPGPDENRFYNELLDKLGAPFKPSSRPDVKHRQVKAIFASARVRILILDEIHNIIIGTPNKQRYFLQVLKYLSNDLKLPIVVAGTEEVANVLRSDDQLSSRFPREYLDLWECDDAFADLLTGFENLLPLAEPSNLASDVLADELFRRSKGVIGQLVEVLTEAACAAVKSDKERITLQTIRSLKFVPSSQRERRERRGGRTPEPGDESVPEEEDDLNADAQGKKN